MRAAHETNRERLIRVNDWATQTQMFLRCCQDLILAVNGSFSSRCLAHGFSGPAQNQLNLWIFALSRGSNHGMWRALRTKQSLPQWLREPGRAMFAELILLLGMLLYAARLTATVLCDHGGLAEKKEIGQASVARAWLSASAMRS